MRRLALLAALAALLAACHPHPGGGLTDSDAEISRRNMQ